MLAERKKILAAVFAVLSAALIFLLCCMHAGVTARAGAAELCQYDQTKIGEDLKEIDLSAYPKNENDVHRLIDGAGFMEYGFSNEESIAGSYYGVYFYVYNPTERELSTRAGANVVNMAVRYDGAGNPTAYENRELLLLDKTENNRFYKFRIANASALYALEKQYQSAHGERRYDVAGLQLWFVGDNNATDSRTGKSGELGVSFSFRCTGYAAGCGPDGSEESTLEMWAEKLDTVELNLKHTFYRTMTSDLSATNNHQVQIDTVYFSVPERYFEQYGKLQRIKAEWYEYKTTPIIVTSNQEFYEAVSPYIGIELPVQDVLVRDVTSAGSLKTVQWRYSPEIDYGLIQGKLTKYVDNRWNAPKESRPAGGWEDNEMGMLTWLFPTKDYCPTSEYDPKADVEEIGGISTNALEKFIYDFSRKYMGGERLDIKDGRTVSAALFEDDIDESRKIDNEQGKIQKGYSYYDFDADADLQEILTYNPSNHNFFENWGMYGFWKALFGGYDVEEQETISPILILNDECMQGSNEEISKRLKVNYSDVDALKQYYEGSKSAGDKSRVVLFRFAVSDYQTSNVNFLKYEWHDYPNGNPIGEYKGSKLPFYIDMDDPNGEKKGYKNATMLIGESVGEGLVLWNNPSGYSAQESVFLNFDVIQLSFNKEGDMTVIPVVASPIDILNPITPPSSGYQTDWWEVLWWLIGVTAGTLAGGIVAYIIKRKRKQRKEGQNGD